ncbi:MAG: CPBP family intramembrane metalloprotease [Anaerolineaceae bacterium]|nr:CPBP family intramembrane metalloprotease [Anaerolineaceae bacterium]
MKPSLLKIGGILEVFLVTFVVVPFLTLGVYKLFPRFETWQTENLGFPFPVFVYITMIFLVLLLILVQHRKPAEYGMTIAYLRIQLDIAGACFIPVVLANLPFRFGVDHKAWGGALLLAAIQISLLVVLAWLLRRKPNTSLPASVVGGVFLLIGTGNPAGATAGKALVLFLTYAFFVGFGEEMLYRGYIQSRLNEVFGKPFRFFSVPFGWGALITALLFGFTHVGILRWILGLSPEVTLPWGVWTVFSGLVFGFVREKSGSVLAPALLHGLPQAIAAVAMLYL